MFEEGCEGGAFFVQADDLARVSAVRGFDIDLDPAELRVWELVETSLHGVIDIVESIVGSEIGFDAEPGFAVVVRIDGELQVEVGVYDRGGFETDLTAGVEDCKVLAGWLPFIFDSVRIQR